MIEFITSLFGEFGVETPSEYAKAIYKNTECGAWTAFITPNGKIYSGDLTKRQDTKEFAARNIIGILHGSIVEGSEAEFTGKPLVFPFEMQDLQNELDSLEELTSEAWEEANNGLDTEE